VLQVIVDETGRVALPARFDHSARTIEVLRGAFRVHDVIGGEVRQDRARETTFHLHAPETRVFRLEP
jgi:hypothetical protein